MWLIKGIREALKNRKRDREIMASLRSKADEQEERENEWAQHENARVLREQIRNESPLEKMRRSHVNRSRAQTVRRTREALQMEASK
jgi:hypothetical protein